MENELTKKLQKIELDILCQIDGLFKANGIRYFIAYGTTLGCVRHRGFIPWDDDVDIFIFGEDYAKVKALFREKDTGFLSLHDYETREGYPYVFPKIVDNRTELRECEYAHLPYMGGVYVDIFPLFSVSDNRVARWCAEKLRYSRYARVRLYYENADKSTGMRRLLSKFIKVMTNPQKVQKKLYATYMAPKRNTEMYAEPLIFDREAYIRSCRVEDSVELEFEKEKFPVPAQYHEYLTDTYGDYMQLPPEDSRVSNHRFAHIRLEEAKP